MQQKRHVLITPGISLIASLIVALAGMVILAHGALAADRVDGDSTTFDREERVSPEPRSLDLGGLFSAANAIELPALAPDDVLMDDGVNLPEMGRVYDVDARSLSRGIWTDLPGGGALWTIEIQSPNASGLRLRFEPFLPPSGAELIIYNADDTAEIYGPFGSSRARRELPLWSPTVYGRRARVEYFLPPGIRPETQDHELGLTGVLQEYPNAEGAGLISCRNDVTCSAAWANEALTVAHIQFVSGGSGFICSGALLNRLPTSDWARLFLTAAHCINTGAEANSVQAFWFFQSSTCNGAVPALGSVPRSVGATLLALDTAPDNVLLGITDDVPNGVFWAGWDSNTIPNPTSGVLIHHPGGARKSISVGVFEGRDDNECANPIDITYRFDLSDGGQEGGSSGAPVFDAAHRVRAVASCSQAGCTADENTWEGSLPNSYDQLAPFLDAQSSIWVNGAYGGVEQGTQSQPWDTIIEGYFGVLGGGTVHIQAGSYPATTLSGDRAMTLVAENGTVVIGTP